MKKTIVIKLGGSVITYKNKKGVFIRRKLINNIARVFSRLESKIDYNIILVHGAGSAGHQIVKKYKLQNGVLNDDAKWFGSFKCSYENQKMDSEIIKIFLKNNVKVFPVHTASTIIQNNKKIVGFNTEVISEVLNNRCIPLLYGEMVFDKKIGMSICSGDSIAPYLAKIYQASKIIYASDIQGLYDKDPYKNKNAVLIEELKLSEIKEKVNLGGSHNVDVTGGLIGKISKINLINNKYLQTVEVFNGLEIDNYKKILLGKKFKHTVIKI